jgi:endonuclease/exonuclease/phosphatase family metal-dependent hydrolase
VRVATWNVLHGRSYDDGRVDLDRFSAAIGELDADVVALQEVDRAQPRSHRADLTARAAAALDAGHHRFVPTMIGEPGMWSPAAPPVAADTGWVRGTEPLPPPVDPAAPTYGVALLSRHPVVAWRVLRLPPARVVLPLLLGRPPRPVLVPDEPRVALAARVRAPWGTVTVATTHLSFAPGWNLVQLRRVVAALADSDDPLVLLGDLNAGGWLVRAASGLSALAVESTFPTWSPVLQLDHALGRGLVGSDARVHRFRVSDHCALAVTVAEP